MANAFAEEQRTLDRAAISVDLYAKTDDSYARFVRDAFDDLRASGLFDQRTLALPVDRSTGQVMTEAFVVGRCPHCNASARAGSCEICYRYNTPTEIVTDDRVPHPTKDVTVWVLDLERFRSVITEWYDTVGILARPALRKVLDDGLSRPLPVVPITYPIDWGIETSWGPGVQRINAWPEITVGHTYWLRRHFVTTEPLDQLTQYMGMDNAFYNVFVYPVIQHGLTSAGYSRTANTVVTVANHYLQLSGRKFSTSKNHVVWAADYLEGRDLDAARLSLALLSPELQETNYTDGLVASLIEDEVTPRLDALERVRRNDPGDSDPVRWARAADASAARFAEAYDPRNPSIRAAAVQVLNDLDVVRDLLGDHGASSSSRSFVDAVSANWGVLLPSLDRHPSKV